jgi:hypothetical protein
VQYSAAQYSTGLPAPLILRQIGIIRYIISSDIRVSHLTHEFDKKKLEGVGVLCTRHLKT